MLKFVFIIACVANLLFCFALADYSSAASRAYSYASSSPSSSKTSSSSSSSSSSGSNSNSNSSSFAQSSAQSSTSNNNGGSHPPRPPTCPKNEIYANCTNNPCIKKNCAQKNLNFVCRNTPKTQNCTKGCLCKDGYLRADNGTCVPTNQCPPVCGENEEPSGCTNGGCDKRNCTQVGRPDICIDLIAGACKTGCVCKQGYLRTRAGVCVPTDQCPKSEVCAKRHEYYDKCPPSCPLRDCRYGDRSKKCPPQPKPADSNCSLPSCRCENGYYRNLYGDCVTFEECSINCGVNEIYNPCPIPTCAAQTCANIDKIFNCPLIPANQTCKGECRCQPDFYRNIEKTCISKEDCSKCGTNEVYERCVTTCPPRTCETKDREYRCKEPPQVGDPDCNPGCRCGNGYFRNSTGQCVPKIQCPPTPPSCGPNEVASDCINNPCIRKNCAQLNLNFVCRNTVKPQNCTAGCLCADGYLRAPNNTCVPIDQCPPIDCGVNEIYYSCPKPTCGPGTCDSVNRTYHCSEIPANETCKGECRCQPNFYTNIENVCVSKEDCGKCGTNEVYEKCVTTCPPRTCETKDRLYKCQEPPKEGDPDCKPGCRCGNGYFRNSTRQCVPKNQCPPTPPSCGPNEVPSDCINNPCIKKNCAQKNLNFVCRNTVKPQNCTAGCLCADGYLRAPNNTCVPIDQCPPITCGSNEIYYPQPESCEPQTCENVINNYGPYKPSNQTCKGQCRCQPNYYRNKIGDCIAKEDCLKCRGPNEYFSCGGACDNYCYNLSKQNQTSCPIVNIVCNRMCYCDSGYARNANNTCVPFSECQPECKENEVYEECLPYCPARRCDIDDTLVDCKPNPKPGNSDCKPGCRCADNYFKNSEDICVPKEQCQCKVNEEYNECPGGVCQAKTCDELGKPLSCFQANGTECGTPGCICKAGYVRNSNGVCIDTKQCPSCGSDSNATTGCGTFCTKCNNYKKPVPCPLICQLNGCECKSGYIYDSEKTKKCVLPKDCPCDVNEEYNKCPGNVCRAKTCDELGKSLSCFQPNGTECGIPGCICKEGYVKDRNGVCIDARNCPSCGGDSNATTGCGTFCTKCNNYNQSVACPAICRINGCQCKSGYIYDSENTKKCVLPKDCPCKVNEEYSECPGKECRAKTCAELGYPLPCFQPNGTECGTPGCICKEGYVKDSNGVCIDARNCPSCGGDSNATTGCGTFCTKCDNYNETVACPASCIINGCECKSGYIYDSENTKKCVLLQNCPPSTTTARPTTENTN